MLLAANLCLLLALWFEDGKRSDRESKEYGLWAFALGIAIWNVLKGTEFLVYFLRVSVPTSLPSEGGVIWMMAGQLTMLCFFLALIVAFCVRRAVLISSADRQD